MLIREKIAIGAATIMLGMTAYDSVFTRDSKPVREPETTEIARPVWPSREGREELPTVTQTPTQPPAPVLPGNDDLGTLIEQEIEERITHEIQDALQQAEDGE